MRKKAEVKFSHALYEAYLALIDAHAAIITVEKLGKTEAKKFRRMLLKNEKLISHLRRMLEEL